MKEQLRNDLLEYLGELMCEKEQTHDYGSVMLVQDKIDAVHILLDMGRMTSRSHIEDLVNFLQKK